MLDATAPGVSAPGVSVIHAPVIHALRGSCEPVAAPPTAAQLPFVSVIIPVRNEGACIACCLDSVLENGYPSGRLEILAVDGFSEDGTRAVLEHYARRFAAITMLDNPKQITPAALNLGIRAARGELVLRLDAHARLAPGYIRQCVAWIESSGADNVGGAMRTLPRGGGLIAAAIAAALGHRFGVGGSAFRTPAAGPHWVDTVFGGCYRREVFERVGPFNERLPRGQDMEFHLRLRRAGGRTLLVPSIHCDYFARCGAASFLRHNFSNGVWAVRPFVESEIVPVRARHLVPLGFVLALSAAGVIACLPLARLGPPLGLGSALFPLQWLGPWPLLLLASCYLAAALAAATQLAWRRRDMRLALVLPAVFLSLHLSYGLGSLWGLAVVAVTAARRARRFAAWINKR
jgi:GT2 family glycosyltransferase